MTKDERKAMLLLRVWNECGPPAANDKPTFNSAASLNAWVESRIKEGTAKRVKGPLHANPEAALNTQLLNQQVRDYCERRRAERDGQPAGRKKPECRPTRGGRMFPRTKRGQVAQQPEQPAEPVANEVYLDEDGNPFYDFST